MTDHTSRCFDGEPDGERGQRRRHGSRHRRKERVLHTRVSENLAEDIRRIADDLRVPASNLVRNVLEEVFDVVESVSDDVGGLLGDVLQEADGARERLSRRRRGRSERRRAEPSGRRGDPDWRAAEEEIADAEAAGGTHRPPPPPIAWHFVDEGRAHGPYSVAVLEDRVRSGRFDGDTLVWCAGMSDWQPASQVPALAALLGPPPVPGSAAAPDDA